MILPSADLALKFRRAKPDDVAQMSEIRLAVSENVLSDPSKLTPQMYLDYLDRLGRGWVCESDGQIVGFSYAARVDSSIWALFVRPGQEGRGIGKELLRLAVLWLFAIGMTEVKLATTVNTRAERFYQAQGWVRGEMKSDVEVLFRLQRQAST